ncbi:MAG: hypothetical protein NVS4B3_04720 [Gemmatimonadaceae bacterium]
MSRAEKRENASERKGEKLPVALTPGEITKHSGKLAPSGRYVISRLRIGVGSGRFWCCSGEEAR